MGTAVGELAATTLGLGYFVSGLGDGPVALALTVVIFVLVAYLAITLVDLQNPEQAPGDDAHPSVRGAVHGDQSSKTPKASGADAREHPATAIMPGCR
jgi:hypothetical protein